ncbi:MAG: diacylglycerol kinase family protein [Dehalococcoidia bacterium]|jgi:diacylglycerol kinase family enzyme
MTDVQHHAGLVSILRTKVIVNPAARGGKTARQWPFISELLKQNDITFDHAFTEGPGHGIVLAKEAVNADYEVVVAVGGDGTVNEVVNGIIDKDGKGRATLGIICTGTGRDCIRSLNIPYDFSKACKVLANRNCVDIDLGRAEYISDGRKDRRYYINTAGLGFPAAVAERTRRLKKMGGTIPFLIAFATVFATYKAKNIVINIDGQIRQERNLLIAVNNGRYFGGGMKIAPDADTCDGLLDIVTVRDVNKLKLLYNFPRLYKGTHVMHPRVSTYQAKTVDVQTSEKLLLQLDGEVVGEAPAGFSIIPSALRVISGGLHG